MMRRTERRTLEHLLQTHRQLTGKGGFGVYAFEGEEGNLHLNPRNCKNTGFWVEADIRKVQKRLCAQCQKTPVLAIQNPDTHFIVQVEELLRALEATQEGIQKLKEATPKNKLEAYELIKYHYRDTFFEHYEAESAQYWKVDLNSHQGWSIDPQETDLFDVSELLGWDEPLRAAHEEALKTYAEKARGTDDQTLRESLADQVCSRLEKVLTRGESSEIFEDLKNTYRERLTTGTGIHLVVFERPPVGSASTHALVELYTENGITLAPTSALEVIEGSWQAVRLGRFNDKILETTLTLHSGGGEYGTLAKAYEAALNLEE